MTCIVRERERERQRERERERERERGGYMMYAYPTKTPLGKIDPQPRSFVWVAC